MRSLVVQHLRQLVGSELEQNLYPNFLTPHPTVEDYIVHNRMDQSGSWGTDREITLLAHILHANVASSNEQRGNYVVWSPG